MNPLEKLSTPIEIYNFKSQQLRVVGTFEDPWFAAKDICDILGISNVTQSLTNIPDKWKGLCKTYTLSGDQVMNIVNESGLYKMILRSNKPEAQPFQEWVCEDVLPGIRKNGEYVLEEYKKKLEDQQKALDEQIKEAQEKQKILEEQQIALEKKDEHIRKLQREKQVVDGKNCVYLCTTDEKESEGIYTIGQTINIEDRLKEYNQNKLFNFKMIKYISCKSAKLMDAIETIILSKLNKYKIISNRDVFQLPEGKDVSFFIQWYDYIAKFCDDIEEGIELEERTEDENKKLLIERKKDNAKLYREENREIISEKQREYREENREELVLRNKIYQKENHEQLSLQKKEYYEENKEQLSLRKKEYYEENKEQLALKNKIYQKENREILSAKDKEYYEKNREKELAQKKKYYEENKEKIIEKNKKYNEENREKVSERLKNYRELNKEKISKKIKDYNNENRDKIIEKRKEKILCECGISVTKFHIKRHFESQTHKNFLKHKISL
jgi:prophage antirepressor-like protein